MIRFLTAYLTVIVVMVVVDIIWLSVIAKPIYQNGIGHLMASQPNLFFAAIFYFVFSLGLMRFAVIPNIGMKAIKSTFLAACVFGFFVYASYDLTNLALLKDWPLKMSLIDIAWGTFLSGISATVGKLELNRYNNV